jgi:hypothetical protein
VKVGRFDSVVAGKGLSRVKDFKLLEKREACQRERGKGEIAVYAAGV